MNNSSFNSSRPKRPRILTNSEDDDSIEAQLESIQTENVKLKKELDAKNAAIANLYVANTELKSNQSNGNDVNEDMMSEMERMKEAEAELQLKLVETQTKMEDERLQYEDEIVKLKFTANARDNEIEELKEQIAVLKDVKVDLGTKNDDIEERHKNEKATLEAKINELNSTVGDLTKQNNELVVGKQNIQKTATKYEKRIKELEEQLQKIKKEIVVWNSSIRNSSWYDEIPPSSLRPRNNTISQEHVAEEVLERYNSFCSDYRILTLLRPLKFEALGNSNMTLDLLNNELYKFKNVHQLDAALENLMKVATLHFKTNPRKLNEIQRHFNEFLGFEDISDESDIEVDSDTIICDKKDAEEYSDIDIIE